MIEPGAGAARGADEERPPPWATALAGAAAGVTSRFAVNPLDVLKIRYQVQLEPTGARAAATGTVAKYGRLHHALATIVREEGIQGLWRGNLAGQLMTVPYTTAQFLALSQCKALATKLGREGTFLASFLGGAVAGAAGTAASYPLDLLRTTLAAQGEPRVYRGLVHAATEIVREHGARGLYRGLSITIVEIIPYSALQFGIYDALSRAWSRRRGDGPHEERKTLQALTCGLISGTVSKLATHPLDLAKKRFQVAGLRRHPRYGRRVPLHAAQSVRGCLRAIVREEGVAGLYKGVGPSLLKAAPAAAITLASYELFLGYLVAFHAAGTRASAKASSLRRKGEDGAIQ